MPTSDAPAHSGIAFVDRDGTINVIPPMPDPYVLSPATFKLLPNALAGLRALNQHVRYTVVVTNQSQIGAGRLSEWTLSAIHASLRYQATAQNARIDAFYHCPHLYVEDACDCRKPSPGMADRAMRELQIPADSMKFVIGDSWRDTGMGQAIGAITIGVRTGLGCTDGAHIAPLRMRQPDYMAEDLLDAAGIVGRLMDEARKGARK